MSDSVSHVDWQSDLLFYLNGKRVTLTTVDPHTTLLEFLRSPHISLTGAKLICGEGGCGGCTVMLSRWDAAAQRPIHSAVNACLLPLAAVDGAAIITVEGIGNVEYLHPIQQRIAEMHGSQCGFCTPGIVMSLYAFLRMRPHAAAREIEEALNGNLCRCTGYRPIIAAAHTFASDTPTGRVGGKVCPSSGKPCDCGDGDNIFETVAKNNMNKPPTDLIFPPELKRIALRPLKISSSDQKTTWYRPTTAIEAVKLASQFPGNGIRPIVGSTEITIERKFKNVVSGNYMYLGNVKEMMVLERSPDFVRIGGSVPLGSVLEFLRRLIRDESIPSFRKHSLVAVCEQLRWFGSTQIRNVACLAGNIATASPISDVTPTLWAVGATVLIQDASTLLPRSVPLDETFILGYRKTRLRPNELIVAIDIPFTKENEFVMSYMQSRRREDDIAIASAAFKVSFSPDRKIQSSALVFGGMDAFTKCAKVSSAAMIGQDWDEHMLTTTLNNLKQELQLAPNAPGGMVDYRRALCLSFFYKFYMRVQDLLKSPSVNVVNDEHHQIKTGRQDFEIYPDRNPVGHPVVGISAFKHATGEATFVDDIPPRSNELHAAYVYSTQPHAKILSIDSSRAFEADSKVIAFFSAKDIPGANLGGLIHLTDECLFAKDHVHAFGQVIGVVVAEDHESARQAARRISVEYEPLEAIITLRDAIDKKSFEKPTYSYGFGDIDNTWARCDKIIEGEVSSGAQNHFYLEPQTAIAYPCEGKDVSVIASTQGVSNCQKLISAVLGVPLNRVEVKVQRVGGGFGGKETRAAHPAATVALAAKLLKRPVRIVVDRDDNMLIFGGRHPIITKYKAGIDSDGKFIALEVNIYIDSGWHKELTPEVLMIALWSASSAYKVPHFRGTGYVCRTNKVSGTVFRATGRPQSIIFAETILEHIAHAVGKRPDDVRRLNLIGLGEMPPCKSVVDTDMYRIWAELEAQANLSKKRKDVDEFNKTNRWIKRGVAVTPILFGMGLNPKSLMQAGALVHIMTDGSVLLHHSGVELGNGISTKLVQIAALTLGVPMETINNVETSTSTVPNSTATCGSITTDLAGPAVQDACRQLRDRLEPIRQKLGPSASFADVAAAAYAERIDLTAHGFAKTYDVWWDWEKGEGTIHEYYTSGAACTVVEIDSLTGHHRILSTDIVLDVGESINQAIDIGQIEGAFMQGYGFYTMEEMLYDSRGCPITRGPGTYKIPASGDVPLEFNVQLLKNAPNSKSIFSSRAIGEPGVILAVSVLTALRDAIRAARAESGNSDWFVLNGPVTCEKIKMACTDRLTALITNDK